MDAEMASWKSTGTYVDAVPPPGANIVSGMWIFRVKRPPGSPPVFKACYVARGFSQRQGVDYFQTFSPTSKMTTLRVLLHVAAHRDYKLHSLDFTTAFLQGSLHEEIWLRRPLGFTGTFPPGTQWSLRRPVYGLRQAPREWHDTLRTTLAALGFAPSTADPSLFLCTDTSLPSFYILVYVDDLVFATADTAGLAHVKARRTITLTQSHMVQQVLQRFDLTYSSPQVTPLSTRHSLSALPSDESVESSGPYPELVGYLMYLMICTRPDLAYPLSILARYVAPGRHRPEHMAAAKRVLRYLCSTSGMGLVLGGRSPAVLTRHVDASWADDQATQRSCEAEIYAGAMAAQELRWLTYLLTDLGEPPRSPPVLYVDNKAMLALCREQRLEHRTKHIALCYFLARELQQRGQLRLAYVASEANTADVFTKALAPSCFALLCLTGLVTTWSPPLCLWGFLTRPERSWGAGPCAYVLRTGDHNGETCGGPHATLRGFGRLTDAWRTLFSDATEIPRWGDLLKSGVAIFDLDYDAILAAMYAVSIRAEGDCYLCVTPDPGIEATALGAGEAALSGTASAQVLHTFTLDSGASRSFFRDCTTISPLSRPVAVSLADPSGGLVLAYSSTILLCPAVPSGSLSGLLLPSFSSNLVSGADLQDAWVAASGQVFAASRSGPESAPCSCMASHVLVTGLPRSLPPLPSRPAPTCVPCVEGRQCAAPHSSEFPPTEAPLQTLHMDVWGPTRVRGQGHERCFLLVVDDYSCYTTVFPLRRKGEVTEVLIDWIHAARRQLSESFGSDLPVLRLHSNRGGEFSSDLLRAFCHAEGIRQTFTLPASPQQNGIAERCFGMINLQPRVFVPETTPTLRWTGKVGDASTFRVWGSRAFVRDLCADKLSSCAVPCVSLGFPPDAPGWQFYHPTSRHVLSSKDVTLDESVPYYHAVEPVEVAVDSGAARGVEPAGAGSGGAERERAEPRGAEFGGAESGGAEPGFAESGGAEPARVESGGAARGGPLGASSWREPLSPEQLRGWFARRWSRAAGAGGATGARGSTAAGATGGAGACGTTGAGAAGGTGAGATGAAEDPGGFAGVGGAAGAGAPGGAGVGATGAAGGAVGAGGVGNDPGGAGAVPSVSGGTAQPRPYFVPLLEQ
ncbi:unnamed protein product, partial [Closterium sp. NIES-53]